VAGYDHSVSFGVQKAWNKLSAMSWDEVRTRLRQELSKRADYALYRVGVSPGLGKIGAAPSEGGKFFFSPGQVQERVALLKKHLPKESERAVAEADEILQHRFRLLGYRDLDYGPEIDWQLDAVHGKRVPLKPWYKIPFLDFQRVGDHKIIWELNRHQHLVTLAKAWALTADDRYAREVAKQFYSWRAANPYPMGINWGSSLELAFRSLSWLWVRGLLTGSAALPDSLDRDLVRGLALNGRYIERYLSTYFSPNTHLIGEVVGLFFIGTLCPQIPAAARWQRKGLDIVLAEAERQVRPDGVYFEQSLYYHVYALDFFLHMRALAACNGIAVPASFDAILARMLEVVRVLTRNGPPEEFGDDDGGRVFNPRRNRAGNMSDPLAVGAALLGNDSLKQGGSLTEEAVWMFGERAVESCQAGSSSPGAMLEPLSSAAFTDGGLYVMAGGDGAQMLIDAGPQGHGSSGHGHADALSVRLWTKDRRWLVDPGSCVYVSAGDERSQFRGTGAHNTLRVDGLDQAAPGNAFSWNGLPGVSAEGWIAGSIFTFFVGSHTGYRRLADPVLHRRMVFSLHGEYWLVRDIAEGAGEHDLEIFWHFAEDVNVAPSSSAVTATPAAGGEKLVLLGASPQKWELAVAEGWVSPVYGERLAAPVASFAARLQLPAEHGTLVLPLGTAERPGRFRLAEDARNAVGYVYERGQVMDYVVFGEGETWSAGPFRSDAGLFFCRTERGEITMLAACSAAKVEIDGRDVFSSPDAVERLEWTRAAGASASDSQSLKFFSAEALRRGTAVT
jgi:hypothetical protein